jgi:cell division protein YceG involved in septum cleavage
MKHYFLPFMLILGIFLALNACSSKEKDDPNTLIAGENSKSWEAKRETNAAGDKEKLDSAEKGQIMEFYTNGTFQIRSEGIFQSGRWNYNAGAKILELSFDDRPDVAESFQVLELKKGQMKLQAADGSTMLLKES